MFLKKTYKKISIIDGQRSYTIELIEGFVKRKDELIVKENEAEVELFSLIFLL